ncbi:hypothetical protein [Candidatus Phycosocius spiralis]|uniref:Uncharacterized protein n=1 Tax=Candidatus Phycosocius spiralis TaxID=2815099 RepID=A0ABQ4PWZ6_9PROT|nr:hypothetical protein [Candidatus Phycosocius spiralis]GIU67586.1 hypothetical protein PsB1_1740 [Candidatus Phycosocius spiralis]
MAIMIVGLILIALGLVALSVGIAFVRVMGEQFDELLPQRMVDLSGFIQFPK